MATTVSGTRSMTLSSWARSLVLSGAITATAGATFPWTGARSQQPDRVNRIVGTWAPASVQAKIDGKMVDLYGLTPAGSLIFTRNMRFSVIVHDPRLHRFASDDRAKATPAEKLAAADGNLALYGSYAVTEDGQFSSQVVEGSSFPNWNGLRRGRDQLTLDADGDTMTEQFANLPDGPPITIVWKRVGG